VFLHALEVAALITVVRCVDDSAAFILVLIVDGWGDPDGGHTHAGYIRHLLLDTGEVASPVSFKVGLCRVEETPALRRVIIRGVSVDVAVGDDLVNDVALKIVGSGCERC